MGLTKYREGSLKELSSIAFPLMITSFSLMFMLFVDRLMLAHYSTAALNAAVNASTLGWSFLLGFSILTGIAEVFVAQYNGANQKFKLGEPVWQMIWLSLGSVFIFIPIAYWGSQLLYSPSLEKDYFEWMLFFGPSFPLCTALSTFFIGQGKTALITWIAVVANIVNIILDYFLIFGIPGILPSFGIKGAAVATFAGTLFQIGILAWVFLNKKNRTEFGTGNYRLNPKLFWQCLKIGFPNSLFVFIELLGWAAFYWLMTLMGEAYITIAGICQSILILFYFFCEGVSKGMITVAGNLIGAKRIHIVPQALVSGAKLHLLFFIALLTFFALFPNWLVAQFLPDETTFDQAFYNSLTICFLITICYLFTEGLRSLLWGLLTAAGDTLFLFISGSLSIWVLFVAPVYYFVVLGEASIEAAFLISLFYSASIGFVYFWRFNTGKWKSISILD